MKKNPKISKGRANYGPSDSDIENCKNCRFYLYDVTGNNQHKCQVVEGLINPSFVSDLYQPQVDFGDNGVSPEAFPVVIENPKNPNIKIRDNNAGKAYNTADMPAFTKRNPLLPGFTREVVSENIRREIGAGKEQDVAVAISLDNARREFRKENKRGRFPKHLQDRRGKNPSCPSCNIPIKNPSTLTPGNYTCTGCGSSITIAKANPIHEDASLGGKFGSAIVLGAGLATGSVIANKVLSGKKKK